MRVCGGVVIITIDSCICTYFYHILVSSVDTSVNVCVPGGGVNVCVCGVGWWWWGGHAITLRSTCVCGVGEQVCRRSRDSCPRCHSLSLSLSFSLIFSFFLSLSLELAKKYAGDLEILALGVSCELMK
jgi:hypothetical protein